MDFHRWTNGARVTWTITVDSEEETANLARTIAPLLGSGDMITLSGDLGAGKSSFARELIRTILRQPTLDVPSPTFTLMQTYEAPEFTILHADLYRISDPEELIELGFEDSMIGALTILEWPEKAAKLLSFSRLNITISTIQDTNGVGRKIDVTGLGPLADVFDRAIAITQLLNESGWSDARRQQIAGDASGRKFERLNQDGRTAILMVAPKPIHGPMLRAGKTYRLLARLSDSVGSFVAIANRLCAYGFSAPEIIASNLDVGLVLMEDLGTEGITGNDGPIRERYFEAAQLLAQLHVLDVSRDLPFRQNEWYRLPDYDLEPLLTELELFIDWFIPTLPGAQVSELARSEFLSIWRSLLEPQMIERKSWTLRDFHSPNLFWLPLRSGIRRVGIIDIQDALWGHPAYDVGSLLQDARVFISEELELELFESYINLRSSRDKMFDYSRFTTSYAIYASQRILKILGIFVRLERRDGKPEYLRHIPNLLKYLRRNLNHRDLANLRDWLSRYCPELCYKPEHQ